MALLVVLETLTPLERAVFVLHEVFGYAHTEIARDPRPQPRRRSASSPTAPASTSTPDARATRPTRASSSR